MILAHARLFKLVVLMIRLLWFARYAVLSVWQSADAARSDIYKPGRPCHHLLDRHRSLGCSFDFAPLATAKHLA